MSSKADIHPGPSSDSTAPGSGTDIAAHADSSGRLATAPAVLGIGAYLPTRVLGNDELARLVETNDAWIRERTGIIERRVSAPGETTADLATRAALAALENAGLAAHDVDLLLVATITGDEAPRATAVRVQHAIGATEATAFDVGLACTGFLAALVTAEQFLRAGGPYQHALVVGVDRLSAITDYSDRDTCVLFGDGAGAVVLGRGEGELLDHEIRVDGGRGDTITTRATRIGPAHAEAPEAKGPYLTMRGREVFRFAVQAFCDRIEQVVQRNGMTLEDLDWIVPHQANQRILEAGARKLGVPMSKVITNVSTRGNTSAASIPIALQEAVADGRVQRGHHIALVAFGGGLSQGVSLLRW
jgi:3-oxoacyl-[acyl-carrier-protein] synthase-3